MKVAVIALAFAACIAGASACGKFAFDDENVGSWTGGCTGAKVSAIDGSAARVQHNIISKVRLYYSEELGCVKGLQARHGWDNPANLVTFGSTEYTESKISLTQGEAINQVAWAAKDGCITYLSFKTNKGRDVTAGSAAGAKVATFDAKEGRYLAAFKGASGNDKACSPLAALSFRWGFDDCEVAAPVEAPAPVEVEVEAEVEVDACAVSTTVTSGFATCADGMVMVAGKAAEGFTCEVAACAAEAEAVAAAPVAEAVAAAAPVAAAAGGKAGIIAVKVNALNSLLAAKQAAVGQALAAKSAAVNSIVAAKTSAVNSAVAAKAGAVNAVVAAKTGRKLRFFGLESVFASKAGAVSSLLNAKMALKGKAADAGAAAPVAVAAVAKTCFKVCAPAGTAEALQAKFTGSA